jgi:hypothetical protein
MVPSFSQQLSRLRNTTIDNFDTALNKKWWKYYSCTVSSEESGVALVGGYCLECLLHIISNQTIFLLLSDETGLLLKVWNILNTTQVS